MKKVLFATTALIATGSVAAADVSFGGYARFGAKYVENAAQETFVTSRFRLNIDASAESDNGLSFNARVRLQADDNGVGGGNAARLNAARFGVSAGGLSVQVGNIAGAIDSMGDYYGYEPGLTNFVGQYNAVQSAFDGYSSAAATVRNGVVVTYEAGAFRGRLSYSDYLGEERVGGAVRYTFGNYAVELAHQESDAGGNANDLTVFTASGAVGPANVVLFVASEEVGGTDHTPYGLSASFNVGAATEIVASYADSNEDAIVADPSYGIGVVHDLGGGTSLRGAVGSANDNVVADLGLRFNF